MTVLEAINKSRDFLASRGIESARLESEWLLGHVLSLPRLQLYLKFERVLTEAETSELRELVRRRGTREPLQHILGTAVFCGIEIHVSPDVLIPRPETELLAEAGWRYLNELGRPSTFLDFGTGSGCIAIALCHNAPQARGIALDKSAAALIVARRNAEQLGERLTFVESDRYTALSRQQIDLIISNPPYIPASDIPALQPEVRDHDPYTALDGGQDGLDFYRYLATESQPFLAPQGKLMAEFGDGQQTALREIFGQHRWSIEFHNDLNRRPRFLIASRQ